MNNLNFFLGQESGQRKRSRREIQGNS